MKICVLQPDYSTTNVDYKQYDPPRDLTTVLSGHEVHHVLLNKLTVYRQLKALAEQGYDIFMNLCDGYFEWEIPSIDVIDWLERLHLPYTGPSPNWYHVSKPVMKYVAYTAGVASPAHVTTTSIDQLAEATRALSYPLFVKPAHAGDSLGIDAASLVHDLGALTVKVQETVAEFGEALIEEFIDGRELTVLVVASPVAGEAATALVPMEYLFRGGLPFKTYANKTSELHPDANVPVHDPILSARLKAAALAVFHTFGGMGYARLDFRLAADGTLHFLEINFTCSVFYSDGNEGSADYILKHDPLGQRGFAERIIAEGIARHARAQPAYVMRGNAVSGYGIFAVRDIGPGEVVFRGEERAQRMVTARRVASWREPEQRHFRQYAYPLSDELFLYWDADPSEWAPQNHSCDANCGFDGLNMVARRAIALGEELTLDYAEFMNEQSDPFECNCGAAQCRGTITGTPGNSVTARERAR